MVQKIYAVRFFDLFFEADKSINDGGLRYYILKKGENFGKRKQDNYGDKKRKEKSNV
jgi:hypothetical protein